MEKATQSILSLLFSLQILRQGPEIWSCRAVRLEEEKTLMCVFVES